MSVKRVVSRGLATLLLAVLASVAVPVAAMAQEARLGGRQHLYYELKPAVVYIWATAQAEITVVGPTEATRTGIIMPDGEQLLLDLEAIIAASGSGWLITPDGYVVTNGHVVQLFHEQNEEKLQAELLFAALEDSGFFEREAIQREFGGPGAVLSHDHKIRLMQRLLPYTRIVVTKNLEVFTQNWRRYPAEVKEYSPPIFPFEGRVSVPGMTLATGKDVAILKIEGRDLPTMVIGDSERMRIGEEVSLAGYPMVTRAMFVGQLHPATEMEASFTRGQVSSVKMDVKGSSVIQYDAATSPGHSGGPLLNERGEVVGMATLGADAGFYFAVPSSVIEEFIRSAGVTPSSGMFDRNWSHALNAYYAGMGARDGGQIAEASQQLGRAVQGFDQALRILPDLRDAVELRREAMMALDTLGAPGPRNWIPWLIGGVIALGLLLLGWGVWARREPREDVVVIEHAEPTVIGSGDGHGLGRLVIQAGPLQGNRFPVPRGGLKIGRDASSCQIVLSEGTVSREHAVLQPSGTNSEVMIRNLSGTNPTYVNDRSVQEATLRSGDRIRIGNSILNYEKE